MKYSVVAVVVTYNKLNMLKECLSNLLACGDLLSGILVINNASTDRTAEYLQSLAQKETSIIFQTEEANLGGAAGFNKGIKRAMLEKPDAIWVMDDDTIPNVESLESLLKAKEWLHRNNSPWGILASNVRWIDGSPANMNVPLVLRDWNKSLNPNLVQIEHSSFVSMFINASAVKRVGYPISEFFIWGDDLEYSNRISGILPCFCVVNSFVIHKMNANKKADIFSDSPERISRYFYDVRNNFYICKKHGMKKTINYAVGVLIKSFLLLFSGRGAITKFWIVLKGFFAGIIFNPQIEEYSEKSAIDKRNKIL